MLFPQLALAQGIAEKKKTLYQMNPLVERTI
jgi:hypothetical protein